MFGEEFEGFNDFGLVLDALFGILGVTFGMIFRYV